MIDISAPVAITWPTGAKSSWTTGKPKTPTRAPHLNSRVTNQASRQANSDTNAAGGDSAKVPPANVITALPPLKLANMGKQ